MVTAGAPSQQRYSSKEITCHIIEEHDPCGWVQHQPPGRQELLRLGLIGDDRSHPIAHGGVTLPEVERIASEHAASHGRPIKCGAHMRLVVLPYACRPIVCRHPSREPAVPLPG